MMMALPASMASSESPQAFRFRWLSFQAAMACLLLLVVFFGGGLERDITESDLWWHLRNAAHLVSTHSFPRVDQYSFTATGSRWLPHEWLSEVAYYGAYRAWGLRGLLALSLALTAVIFVGLYDHCCRSGANPKTASIAVMVGIMLASISFGPRMMLFGWLWMAVLLIILHRFVSNRSGPLWLIPPLFCVWINCHGSWLFGLLVLGIFIVSGLAHGEWGRVWAVRFTPSELKKLALVTVLSVGALFVNPFGYRLVFYPFDLLFRQQVNINSIEEWSSVDFHTARGKIALALLLALLGAALTSRRRWKVYDVLLGGFALSAALTYLRLQFFAALVFIPLLAIGLPLFPPSSDRDEKPWLNAAIMIVAIVTIILRFPSEARLESRIRDQFPEAAVAFMNGSHIAERVFNEYAWGGYLIWHAPQVKTFIDGRADLFVYNGVFDDYLRMTRIDGTLELLDHHRIQYALLSPYAPLSYLLGHSACWRDIYKDRIAVVYQRRPAPAACSLAAAAAR